MSSGDKTLSENYLQHADHFMRIIEDKNRNRNQNKVMLLINKQKIIKFRKKIWLILIRNKVKENKAI